MSLDTWAAQWNIPRRAIAELSVILDSVPEPPRNPTPHSEAATQVNIRLAAPHRGVRLWRNNVGALLDQHGREVRYGLANESKKVNARVKSADLIGICPVQVTREHLGRTLGVFVSIECKRGAWGWTGSAREEAQRQWRDLVAINGGLAGFARNVEEFDAVLEGAWGGT